MRIIKSPTTEAKMASHKSLLKSEKKLSHRVRSAKPHQLAKANKAYINSLASKYVAALELKEVKSKAQALEIAAKIDLGKPSGGKVTVKAAFKGKPANYEGCPYRFTYSFGIVDKARQAVLKKAIKARGGWLPQQTMLNGGRNLAVKQIRKHYREGNTYIAKMDVSACYNSFENVEVVAQALYFPKQVVRSTLMGQSFEHGSLHVHKDTVKDIFCLGDDYAHYCDGMRLFRNSHTQKNRSINPLDVFDGRFGDDWVTARQGLIQGAKCSGHAAEVLLRSVCEACCLIGDGQVVNYADDFLLMAPSLDALLRMIKDFELACSRHPAGALKATKEIIERRHSFEFLGYHFEPARRNLFTLRWGSNSENRAQKIRKETYSVLHSNADLRTKERTLNDCVRIHRNCIKGFPDWSGGEKHVERKLKPLFELLDRHETHHTAP